jgi:hypothetical protein
LGLVRKTARHFTHNNAMMGDVYLRILSRGKISGFDMCGPLYRNS